jgi:hypothetical protein
MDCYNISLHGFFYFYEFFFFVFSKWSFSILFSSYWAGWEFCFVVFLKKNIVDCYNVSPHDFCFATVFPHIFFSKLSLLNFFYIELVKNLALTFPTCFISHFFLFLFLFDFFSKLSSSFYFFCVFFQNYFC